MLKRQGFLVTVVCLVGDMFGLLFSENSVVVVNVSLETQVEALAVLKIIENTD